MKGKRSQKAWSHMDDAAPQAVEKRGESREGFGPLAFQSWAAACTATTGADFAAEIRRIPAKFGDGGCGGGVCFPVRRLVEKSFVTSYGATWSMRLH